MRKILTASAIICQQQKILLPTADFRHYNNSCMLCHLMDFFVAHEFLYMWLCGMDRQLWNCNYWSHVWSICFLWIPAKNLAFLPSCALYQAFELQTLSCKCMCWKTVYFIKLWKFSSLTTTKKKVPPSLNGNLHSNPVCCVLMVTTPREHAQSMINRHLWGSKSITGVQSIVLQQKL